MRACLIFVCAALTWSFAGCSSSSKTVADTAPDVRDTNSDVDAAGDGSIDAQDSAAPPTYVCDTATTLSSVVVAEVNLVNRCFSGRIGYSENYPNPDVTVDIGVSEGIVVDNAASQAFVASLQSGVSTKLQNQCIVSGLEITTGALSDAQAVVQLIHTSHADDLFCNGVTFDANGVPVFEDDASTADASVQAIGYFNGEVFPCLANLTILDPLDPCPQ